MPTKMQPTGDPAAAGPLHCVAAGPGTACPQVARGDFCCEVYKTVCTVQYNISHHPQEAISNSERQSAPTSPPPGSYSLLT